MNIHDNDLFAPGELRYTAISWISARLNSPMIWGTSICKSATHTKAEIVSSVGSVGGVFLVSLVSMVSMVYLVSLVSLAGNGVR